MPRPTKLYYEIKGGIILLILALLIMMLVVFGTADNHHTNIRYLVWKSGLTPSQYEVGLHYLIVDSGFRQSLNGKTMAQLHGLFPVLVPPSMSNRDQRELSLELHMSDQDFRWIDDSSWVIQLQDGRVVDLKVFKSP